MGRAFLVLMVVGLAAVVAVGCEDEVDRLGSVPAVEGEGEEPDQDAGRVCTPRSSRPCACTPDRTGVQTCVRAGSGWTTCLCYGIEGEGEGAAEGDCAPGVVDPEAPVSERWVRVCPGEFLMGSPEDEPWRDDEEPRHRVALTRPCVVQATEVTQGQWRAVAAAEGWAVENPARYDDNDSRPVETVNWWEALRYLNALSRAEGLEECYVDFAGCDDNDPGSDQECGSVTFSGLDCTGYRLPTESEWEYAARAGTSGMFYNCDPPGGAAPCDDSNMENSCGANADLAGIAVYCDNDPGGTATVGSKGPAGANPWGLHDMLGNVWEWTWDRYDDDYGLDVGQLAGTVTDPLGDEAGGSRVIRGGSWLSGARYCRAANRFRGDPGYRNFSFGFRPARSVLP